ncbi:MAG: M24 family metallopeptidase [Actinomycetota bacterium]
MPDRHLDRIGRAAKEAEAAGAAALLVAPSADMVYLAGYDPPPLERLTCLVVRADRDPVLLVPELERPRAVESPVGKRIDIEFWSDGQDPYQALSGFLPDDGVFGTSDRMWAVHLLGAQRIRPDARFVPASPILSRLRAVKDDEELELLSRAGRGADEAFRHLVESQLEGLREEEVAVLLSSLLRENGHESVAFTIVGSGPNGASPHHEPGGRSVRAGDPVVLDFGGRVGGYCSDISRTVCVGESPEGFTEVYDVVREAQEAAFRAIRPGVSARDVDAAARSVIESAGYGERFIHRTGHGIGLEEHEPPWIASHNDQPLEVGMCFSIEPGIYLEGRFGVRIEDIVAVTQDGANRLNRASRDLVTVA